MKKIGLNQPIQVMGQNVGMQFKGVAQDDVITGNLTKAKCTVCLFSVAPPAAGDWSGYVSFKDMDEQHCAGKVDPDSTEYIFDETVYYKVLWVFPSSRGDFYMSKSDCNALDAGTAQSAKIYWHSDVETEGLLEIGLIDTFGDLENYEESYDAYRYKSEDGILYLAQSFIGDDGEVFRTSDNFTIDEDDTYPLQYDLEEYYGDFYFKKDNSYTTVEREITGEMTETSDWEGYKRYLCEEDDEGKEGYLYILTRQEDGDIYPCKGDDTIDQGTQGAITVPSISSLDIEHSINGADYIKNKDVASAVEILSNIPRGVFFKVTGGDTGGDYDIWITEK